MFEAPGLGIWVRSRGSDLTFNIERAEASDWQSRDGPAVCLVTCSLGLSGTNLTLTPLIKPGSENSSS